MASVASKVKQIYSFKNAAVKMNISETTLRSRIRRMRELGKFPTLQGDDRYRVQPRFLTVAQMADMERTFTDECKRGIAHSSSNR